MKVTYWKAKGGNVVFRLRQMEAEIAEFLESKGIDTSKAKIRFDISSTSDSLLGEAKFDGQQLLEVKFNMRAIDYRTDLIKEELAGVDPDDIYNAIAKEYAVTIVATVMEAIYKQSLMVKVMEDESNDLVSPNIIPYFAYRDAYKCVPASVLHYPYFITAVHEPNEEDWRSCISASAAWITSKKTSSLYEVAQSEKLLYAPNVIDHMVASLEEAYQKVSGEE